MNSKPHLLFLCHRIPYPPNKGDKIRSYHLLRYLCDHYQVHLGAFVDDNADWEYRPEVEALCASCKLIGLPGLQAKIKSLKGLLTGQALSLPFYESREMQNWVDQTIAANSIDRAVIFSSVMGQFLLHRHLSNSTSSTDGEIHYSVMDCVDIDSDKWRQYSQQKPWPMSWLYRREANKLLAFEKEVLEEFDQCLFVSPTEAAAFRKMVPETYQDKIAHYCNGVDFHFFDPGKVNCNPYPQGKPVLLFTGAMDYWPNVDAVTWFAESVLPKLREQHDLVFYIVGRNPTPKVKKLAEREGVVVTGGVEDIRPYIRHADIAVAPMRIARGIQNKVLEAMAMARPVMVSSLGLEGLDVEVGEEVILADTVEDYLEFVPMLLSDRGSNMGFIAREKVVRSYSWEASLPKIGKLLAT
ncbi:TIGR03087 family PEP-CTERM/XrtA system glycosyltransferase [Pseudomaricurvus alkylphenolicus]|uniref:TIGR03087 family PEP-CTERM/XrtA system glycosyltransferase n=1 Tax=Pseudomaricurvus alkylphenolicus TaxID=1306991 RepID=UPI001422E5DD|nr:TIGR03087 family PEP-CTERM/XrtA system glycosyltransferase [Pseudomaricurvus alkylphenolicus]NIB43135.1 TIGR03087 family PEP-CTERM/XrtA system glycosyltransferase [Pseudomaricurvus alkylphenolicus]